MSRQGVPVSDSVVSHGHVRVVDHVDFCHVCQCPSVHPDVQMGVFGVDGDFFCSMDCHDQHQCQRAAVVFAFVHDGMGSDGQFVDVACRGPHGSMAFRCPACDFRSRSVQG